MAFNALKLNKKVRMNAHLCLLVTNATPKGSSVPRIVIFLKMNLHTRIGPNFRAKPPLRMNKRSFCKADPESYL